MLFPVLIIRPLQRDVPWKSQSERHATLNYTTNDGGRVTARMTRASIEDKAGEAVVLR
jgi:hypothetical protein